MNHNLRTRSDVLEHIYVLSGILCCGWCGQPMHSHSSNGVRYYQDKSRIQHLADCPQTYVRADDVEEQFTRLTQSIKLPSNWREEVVVALHHDLDAAGIQEQEAKLEARLERAKRLYVDGDVDEAQHAQEKMECQARLADLRPADYDQILAVGKLLKIASQWHKLTPLQKKRTVVNNVRDRSHSRDKDPDSQENKSLLHPHLI